MRVTAEVKVQTKERIVDAARELFDRNGFEQTTTRDIARATGLAVGTLFNYFPSKEALAMSIIAQALDEAEEEFEQRLRGDESLEEALFLYVLVGLRRLRPFRHFVGPVMETAWSAFARSEGDEQADRLRVRHLERVARLVLERAGKTDDSSDPFSLVAGHLYWTLYLGILAFWTRDASPNQEDTMAVLDQSLRLFAASLEM
jgi:AcrR family transcriptional regulator